MIQMYFYRIHMIMAQAKLPQIQSYDPVEEKINTRFRRQYFYVDER